MGFGDGSGISWTICKQSAPRSRQITNTSSLHFHILLQAVCSSWPPTNSVKALKANMNVNMDLLGQKKSVTHYKWRNRTSRKYKAGARAIMTSKLLSISRVAVKTDKQIPDQLLNLVGNNYYWSSNWHNTAIVDNNCVVSASWYISRSLWLYRVGKKK